LTAVVILLAAVTFEQGERLYQQNQFKQARDVFLDLSRQKPASSRVRLMLGYSELALGNNAQAIQTLEPLEREGAADEEFLYSLSEAYTREARDLATRITALGEPSARAHQLLAYRYQADGNARAAEAEFRKAVSARPSAPGIHFELANYLWTQQRYNEAAAELREELRLQPMHFMSNLRYGQYLLREGKCEAAQEPLRLAARHRRFPEAFQLLAYAMETCGDAEGARSVTASGLKAFPNDSGLMESQAKLGAGQPWRYVPLSESPVSARDLRRRVKADDSDEDALFLLSQHYSVRGQELADALGQLAPESFRTIQLKATSAEYAGDAATAEQLYRAVLSKKPDLHGIHYSLGHVLTQLGRDKEAEDHFHLELKRDPLHYLAWYELGASLLKRGDAASARESLARAASLRPNFVPANLELAKAMLQGGEPAQAIPYLQQVINREPAHTSAHFLLYRAYLRVEKKAEAARELATHQKLLKQRNATDQAGMR
jgi:predicted Zn-dependent protease